MRPSTGPAHGAQRRPVAAPSRSDETTPGSSVTPGSAIACDTRPPIAASGANNRSDSAGTSRNSPKSASTTIATKRPYRFASTAQLPPTAASVPTAQNAIAIPANIGRPLRTNERSARANTNGTTGRMQGLTIVSTPPRYATTKSNMRASSLSRLRRDRLEGHREAVHAITQAGGPRAVIEHVTQMPPAAPAMDGFADHAQRRVRRGADGVLERRPEARPSR